MGRLAKRTAGLIGAYLALILVLIVGGFLGSAVGIWATVLWAALLVTLGVAYLRRRQRPAADRD
jgi:hypothetical protein